MFKYKQMSSTKKALSVGYQNGYFYRILFKEKL